MQVLKLSCSLQPQQSENGPPSSPFLLTWDGFKKMPNKVINTFSCLKLRGKERNRVSVGKKK